MSDDIKDLKICIVGLGYVGLPLAIAFSKKFETYGFDINQEKIDNLKKGIDTTNEISKKELEDFNIELSNDPTIIKDGNIIIAAVPTPITKEKVPDLSLVESASELIGKNLSKGAIVVFESTVYPGVTEEICVPILEKSSGLKYKSDFFVGYSPERINPGDKKHTVDKIIKIVSGCDKKTTEKIAEVYGAIVNAGIHTTPDIKTAEAAKVIENIQRDLNIALVNELSLIFNKMDINTTDVLEAAGTKWNFHKYSPGLVGGHCIGVDPYYLTWKAKQLGYNPKIILAGRAINEFMPEHVVNLTEEALKEAGKDIKNSKILILGLTFKENVPDARNSKAKEVIQHLKKQSKEVIACDPLLSKEEIKNNFSVDKITIEDIDKIKADAVIIISPHKDFEKIRIKNLTNIMEKPVLIDIKSFYRDQISSEEVIYKTL
ncbi:nucleotide sugar dehydrogenase [Nanoarchaeota archaeon]